MSLTLYQIDAEIAAILAYSDESGELMPDAVERLDQLEMDRVAKLTAIVAEIARLKAMKAAPDNAVERLKSWMFESMVKHGETKIDCGALGKPRLQKSPPSVRLADGADIHNVGSRFKRIIVELDKTAILAAFKAGELLPEEVDVVVGSHLRLN